MDEGDNKAITEAHKLETSRNPKNQILRDKSRYLSREREKKSIIFGPYLNLQPTLVILTFIYVPIISKALVIFLLRGKRREKEVEKERADFFFLLLQG